MSASLILASTSPRRRELMGYLGLPFEVVPSNVPEIPQPGETPEQFAQRAAREKALEVGQRNPGRFVLAADTVVALNGTILGKPADRDDARRMLAGLSGETHNVFTAVTLMTPAGRIDEVLVRSQVEFRRVTDGEIETYLDSDEPFDKAGAYAVQGLASTFVRAVRGSYSNVIGLPLDAVAALLRVHLPRPAGAST